MSLISKSVILKHTVSAGLPTENDFEIVSSEVPALPNEDKWILVQLLVLSADPYLRGRIKTPQGIAPGTPMVGFVAGKVLESRNPEWTSGDLFGASLPFSSIQHVDVTTSLIWKLTGLIDESQISLGIGILGMPGATVVAGLSNCLRPKEGEVLYVNAAAGAVGGLVGQLAKHIYKCKVIGSAGGPEKCRMLVEEFGLDHAIDYKTVHNKSELQAKLREISPSGIDMAFENVGGFQFDAAIAALRVHGRIALCGAISGYNDETVEPLKLDPQTIIYKQLRVEGILSSSVLGNKDARDKFLKDMAGWVKEGRLVVKETITNGIENWPHAFHSLFVGSNTGKVVVVL